MATGICERIAMGENVADVCAEFGITYTTLRHRRSPKGNNYDPDFAVAYEEAMRDSSYILADEAVKEAQNRENDYFENMSKDGRVYTAPNSAAVQRSKLIYEAKMKKAQIRNTKFRLNDQLSVSSNIVPVNVTHFGKKPPKKTITQEGSLPRAISVLEKIRKGSKN